MTTTITRTSATLNTADASSFIRSSIVKGLNSQSCRLAPSQLSWWWYPPTSVTDYWGPVASGKPTYHTQ